MSRVPGDKSIAHRALLFAALADGESRLSNVPDGLDVAATERAIVTLGARVRREDDVRVVHGTGGRFERQTAIDCANSGTTMRLTAGMLATRPVVAAFDGDRSLRARPMRRLAEPLGAFGARLDLAPHGTAPFTLRGAAGARATDVQVPIASAQLRSAVLFAALGAEGTTRLRGPLGARDHTERFLRGLGAALDEEDGVLALDGPFVPRAFTLRLPGDFSSAAFLLAAAAAVPGARAVVDDVGLNPTRTAFLAALRRFGASVETVVTSDGVEPAGRVVVTGAPLRGITVTPAEVPGLVDELPLVGVLGAFARGETVVSGAGELRVKESDRIATFVQNARACGVAADETEDGFRVRGRSPLRSAAVATHGDHRIAMAFAVLARAGGIEVRLDDPACVAVSFPAFADALLTVA